MQLSFKTGQSMFKRILLLVVAHAVFTVGNYLDAQTLFEWPSSKIDVTRYNYIDNCVSVERRVSDSIRVREVVIVDTLFSPRSIGGLNPRAANADPIESTKECLARFNPQDIPREYTILAHKLFLDAHRFEDADKLVNHGLSLIPATDVKAASYLVDSIVMQYAQFIPFQMGSTMAFMEKLESYGPEYRDFYKLRAYFWIALAANQANNDSLAFRAANRVLELVPLAMKGASPQEIAAVAIGAARAVRMLRGQEMVDSLRKSTSGYVSMLQNNLKQSLGYIPSNLEYGQDAPKLKGDFWFPHSASSAPLPASGKVSLVVFVPSRSNLVGNVSFLTRISVIRRLAERYPDVQMIFASQTAGYFGPLEPPEAKVEAQLLDSLIRTFYGIKNSILTVTQGTFVQLPEPDSRRVYMSYENIDSYPPEGTDGSKAFNLYLIDENAKVVDRITPDLEGEGWAIRLIDALLDRQKKSINGGRQ